MNPMPALTPMLKEIRLSGILDSLEARNRQAIEDKLAYTDFLALLLQDEVARRSHKKLAVRLRRANFRNQKTLEDFDFAFNPSLNRALILDLATGRYIEEKVPVLIAGPTGTGKSHIAQALGHCAIRQGYDVLFTTQSKLLGLLQAARATNTFERRFQSLAQTDLLIIDDFGLKPIRPPQDEDFHDLIADRYERRAYDYYQQPGLPRMGRGFPQPALRCRYPGPTPSWSLPGGPGRRKLPGSQALTRKAKKHPCERR